MKEKNQAKDDSPFIQRFPTGGSHCTPNRVRKRWHEAILYFPLFPREAVRIPNGSDGLRQSFPLAHSRYPLSLALLTCLFLSVSACTTPVGVKRIDPRAVHRALTTNILSANTLSTPTQNVLYRRDLSGRFENDPA